MTTALESLATLLDAKAVALVIRHAEREAMPDPSRGHDIPLTERGIESARDLGRALAALLTESCAVVVSHSPVPRCARTAEAIVEGMSVGGQTGARVGGPRDHLGGPYLRDHSAALARAGEDGALFLRQWFDGSIDRRIVAPLDEAAREQVSGAVSALGHARLEIMISHDWNVMILKEHLFGLRHEEHGWADFLDGVALARDGDRVRAAYGSNERSFPGGLYAP